MRDGWGRRTIRAGEAVLGLWDGHESGAALAAEGKLLFALSEERPRRRKRFSGFPFMAVQAAVRFAASARLEIAHVALAGRTGRLPLRLLEPWYSGTDPHRDPLSLAGRAAAAWENIAPSMPGLAAVEAALARLPVAARLRSLLPGPFSIRTVPHHEAHAFSALLCRHGPSDLALTWDAYGEGIAGTVRRAGDPLTPLAVLPVRAGLARLYGAVTVLLGFREGDEGKVMGLAARGDPEALAVRFRDMFRDSGRDGPLLASPLRRGPLRRIVAGASPEDAAAGLQAVVEELAARHVARLLPGEEEDPVHLLLAGGLFANILVNRALARLPGCLGVRVFPAMTDGGLPAGAAARVWHALTGSLPEPARSMYLGPVHDGSAALAEARRRGFPVRPSADPAEAAARHVAAGRVVCLCAGRDEFGPRALGNRSILFSAARPELAWRVNRCLGRDGFMPFGPAVAEQSAAGLWAEDTGGSDLSKMTIAVAASESLKGTCPAAVHLDGTSRPQVVRRGENPMFHRMLTLLHRSAGQPCAINTSFNMHGEPIVHTPLEALDAFNRSGLDVLLLGDHEVTRGDLVA